MGDTSYQLILEGVSEGFTLEEVKQRLAEIFKTRPEKMDALFTRTPFVLKKGLDNETAERYKSVFQDAGVSCRVEALGVEKDVPSEPQTQQTIVCPKCGHEQPDSESCIRCGIIIQKFMKSQEEEDPGEEEPLLEQKRGLEIDKRFYEQEAEVEEPVSRRDALLASASAILGDHRRLITAAVVGLVMLLSVLEFLYLKGDLVAEGSIRIDRRSDHIAIPVDDPYENYAVEVSTKRKKRRLSFIVEDPLGRIIYEDTEYTSHKGTRRFSFQPDERGTYTLYVNSGALSFGERGYANVRVYVNDRRVLSRLFGWFNF